MLSAFSSNQQAALFNIRCLVVGKAHKSTRYSGGTTRASRQSNFLSFCQERHLKEPTASHIPTEQSNFLLACYVISLIQGDNILGMNLQATMIGHYVTAAALLYTDRDLPNPYTDKKNQDKLSQDST